MYAAPFYGESSLPTTARTCSKRPGWRCRAQPTYEQIRQFAATAARPRARRLRHLPARRAGLGPERGVPQHPDAHLRRALDGHELAAAAHQPAWIDAMRFYVDLLRNYGPPGSVTDGYNEDPRAVRQRKLRHVGGLHRRGGLHSRSSQSRVARPPASPKRPSPKCPMASAWVWGWALAIPNPRPARRPPSGSSSGPPASAMWPGWAPVSAGCGRLPEPANPPMKSRVPAGRALRAAGARRHSERGLSPGPARCRCPMWASSSRHSGISGHR